MTHIYIIRHAKALDYNNAIDPGLSPLGITQAEKLRNRLATTGEIRADALISSPLVRAKETAEIIAPVLGLPVLLDNECQEFLFGEMEGLSDEESTARFGDWHVEDEPFRKIAPGGESLAEFVMRVYAAFDRFTRIYQGKTVVLVGHGGTLKVAFLYFFGLPLLRDAPITASNASITHWYKEAGVDKRRSQWYLSRFNDYAHLLKL